MGQYEVVVFGGTGYTGEHVVREMLLTSVAEGVTWAVAGRSRDKIESMLERLGQETGASTEGLLLVTHESFP